MRWRNNHTHWGVISKLFHWLSAVVIIGLFALGLWMTDLTYYDTWYHKAPHIHRSLGVLFFLFTVTRLLWRLFDGRPAPLSSHKWWEQRAAHWTHLGLYLLLFAVMISGYLISTADGRPVSVFGWFSIPATLHGIDGQEDVAGLIHLTLAIALIGLALLHSGAALKHHFIDRDTTLTRMLGK